MQQQKFDKKSIDPVIYMTVVGVSSYKETDKILERRIYRELTNQSKVFSQEYDQYTWSIEIREIQ